ncbi:NAD(P)-binding domain-containing protein [Iamia sp. SCSIO 61187]|uniref:NADPH-dependent F420 reductase n=1 Tax=Iamia sp. SCSIO 61187 TaxID=2722752 RepID=UPI001C632895|nr:NAD(P)-binding domain-containing protein [Iamia sp. SCSIO 61187]QYG91603.1 NAD(P)-binding domain-containing protein [Iamia sp. SCSIO 61187]
MEIAILGTGSMALSLATAWGRAGHTVRLAGRSPDRAAATAAAAGHGACATDPLDVATGSDIVVLAVPDDAVEPVLERAGGPEGMLAGLPLLDCVNTFAYPSGRLTADRGSASERAQHVAVGSRVVKALTHFAGTTWRDREPGDEVPTVAMAGDDPDALAVVAGLVRDLGGRPVTIGGLDRARQIEEAAGFIVGVVGAGADPRTAVPSVPAPEA